MKNYSYGAGDEVRSDVPLMIQAFMKALHGGRRRQHQTIAR